MFGLSRKNMSMLILLAGGIVFVVFSAYDFFPQVKQITFYHQKIGLMKAAAKTLTTEDKASLQKKLQDDLARLEGYYKKLQSIKQEAHAKVTGESNVPMVTLMVEDLATANDIELRLIKPLPMEERGEYERLPIALEFNCEYGQLVKFIAAFESLALPVSVQDVVVAARSGESLHQDVKLTISVIFFAV